MCTRQTGMIHECERDTDHPPKYDTDKVQEPGQIYAKEEGRESWRILESSMISGRIIYKLITGILGYFSRRISFPACNLTADYAAATNRFTGSTKLPTSPHC
jgi:hypothetical protein